MGRRRTRLVPEECVEVFEVRVVMYFDSEGDPVISYDIDKPDNSGDEDIPTHEILGVMDFAAKMIYTDRHGV